MGYKSLAECVLDLERHGHLIRIKEEVDPHLEMAAIHMRVFDKEGPALFLNGLKVLNFLPFPIFSVHWNVQSLCSGILWITSKNLWTSK